MNSKPTTASVMTGFIVDEGCLSAVLKGQDGETQLYDHTALAWIINEAPKAGTQVPNYENTTR